MTAGKPSFIIHGECDELIPLKEIRKFYGQLPEPKELVVIDGADHLFDGKVTEVGDGHRGSAAGLRWLTRSSCQPCERRSAKRRQVRFDRLDQTSWQRSVMREALNRAPGVAASEIEDVILGCAMPEAEQGLNVARIASLRAGFPVEASAVTINRFCASGLQAIAFAADRIRSGSAHAIIAGGTESMSLVPMGGNKIAPNPALVDHYPDVYLTTGLVAENHARDHHISREEQDAFALRSHQRALAAMDAGRFRDETIAVGAFAADEGPRRDTSHRRAVEASSRVSRERIGHGRQLLADERRRVRRARHIRRHLRGSGSCAAGAIRCVRDGRRRPRALRNGTGARNSESPEMAGLSMSDIDLIELNEAFAAQVLACLRELPMDEARLNVNGGAIALGHPAGLHRRQAHDKPAVRNAAAAGALRPRDDVRRGGMGAAGILERVGMTMPRATKGGGWLLEPGDAASVLTPERLSPTSIV